MWLQSSREPVAWLISPMSNTSQKLWRASLAYLSGLWYGCQVLIFMLTKKSFKTSCESWISFIHDFHNYCFCCMLSNMAVYGAKSLKPTQLFGTMLEPKTCLHQHSFSFGFPSPSWCVLHRKVLPLRKGPSWRRWSERPLVGCVPKWLPTRKKPKRPWLNIQSANLERNKCRVLRLVISAT